MARTFSLTIAILLFTFSVISQDAMPTKEETVKYIQKKLAEVEGHRVTKTTDPLKTPGFKLNQGMIEATFPGTHWGNGTGVYGSFHVFDPKHIAEVKIERFPHWDMDNVVIKLTGKLMKKYPIRPEGVIQNSPDKVEMTDVVGFWAIKIPGNPEKLIKAFLHLRDLAKAEDELF